jgi:hypothetical protein
LADIGSILRETRIRDKIDITAVEEATKIRAKYLRALENEEWSVLPGPSYVKSFLRTYAEFLGVDPHMLVEEYRARYERPDELELPAFSSPRPLRSRMRTPGPPSRGGAIAALALGFLALLFVLGITAGDDDDSSGNDERRTARTGDSGRGERGRTVRQGARGGATGRPAKKGRVSLSVVAQRPVWVCVVDGEGKTLVGGRTLAAGDREGPFRARRFRVTLGNGGGDLRVNGRPREVPDSAEPIGYSVSASGTKSLPEERRPNCG